ncbi:hypothetical protein VSDG_03868 [Cytospora chrysosperma]|uniref:Actin-related protein 4 n=1 Tax=Cytospora chrysosperma TaxID=252740 RepID=A0A423W7E0_CYTCH|nr:hypothetical protein VSDG_03868 [Valsa sordida]
MAAQGPISSSQQPQDIYGGDEISAMVLDPGYCNTRAGFAGEDSPKCVLPSFYSRVGDRDLFGDECIRPRENLELRNYMNTKSEVEDWDVAANIWENMLVKRLNPPRQTPPSKNGLNDGNKDGEGDVSMEEAAEEQEIEEKALSENPILLTEPATNPSKKREKAIEVIFENWGTPAFWLSRTPVLSAFAAGKATALVIEVGGANTSVTAVHDGMTLKKSAVQSPAGGLWLSQQIRTMLQTNEPKIDIVPTYMIENKTPVDAGTPPNARLKNFPFQIHDSFRRFEEERLMTEFKESVVEVWKGPGRYSTPGNEEFIKSQPGRVFEMPDGYNQMWREQRFKVTEGMWDDAVAYPSSSEEWRLSKEQTIPGLIKRSLELVDVDLRPHLLGNIVVTGATSLLNGFNDRLNNELMQMYPGMKIKLHAAGLTTERRFGAWVGGSILGSLGSFHQMWISRKEYEENGAGVVEKRCK